MAMTRKAEQKLIKKAAAGDREAASELIKAHQRSLYAYIFRLSGRADIAEDTVQEAFVRVLTNLHRFDPKYRFSTWLFTIAKRLFVNANQKLKPAYDSDIVGSWRGNHEQPAEPFLREQDRNTARTSLDNALLELSETQREIIVLFHQLDWPIAIIAEHMGMPDGTIKSHLHRGRKRLREILSSNDAEAARLAEVFV